VHKAACRVQLSEFLLRRSRQDVVRRQVLDWACHLVRRDRRDAEDIFLELRLRGAMAYQGAARWDVGQVRLQVENSEARRDVAAHQKVVRRDGSDIFGLVKEDRQQGASFPNLFPNLFLKPTRDFQLAQQRRDVVQRERPAGRVLRAEVELLDAPLMEQLQVLTTQQEQPSQEPRRVSQQQVLEKVQQVND
jgi:hypothetical protein